MITTKDRILGLDIMRALAIAMVVMSHINYIFLDYDNLIIDTMQLMGVIGVEIFFVLSGFLIGDILLKLFKAENINFSDIKYFWVRRWFRTLPLYFLMLFINAWIAFFAGFGFPNSLWKYMLFAQNLFSSDLTFFPESWSLSVEEYAYLLAPICLFISYRIFKKSNLSKELIFLRVSLFLVFIFLLNKIIFHFSHVNTIKSVASWNLNLKGAVIFRLDAIFYGFILVSVFKKYHDKIKRLKNELFLIGSLSCLSFAAILPYLFFNIEHYSLYWNVMYLPIISISISLMLPYLFFIKISQGNIRQIIQNISLYSYSMYLLHYSFLLYIMRLYVDFEKLNSISRFMCVVVYLLSTYLLSRLVYTYFEKPITDLRDSAYLKRFFGK